MTRVSAGDPTLADGETLREEIARLEGEIENLADSIERCRKLSLFARLAISGGAIWMFLILMRVIAFAPFHLVGAIAALLGGIVLFGSNSSTGTQLRAALGRAEARRTELIGRIALRMVDAPTDG
jgi:hypothetical protein